MLPEAYDKICNDTSKNMAFNQKKPIKTSQKCKPLFPLKL